MLWSVRITTHRINPPLLIALNVLLYIDERNLLEGLNYSPDLGLHSGCRISKLGANTMIYYVLLRLKKNTGEGFNTITFN